MQNVETEKSELAQALEKRQRRLFEFDALNFIGPGERPVGKVKIRVATKAEQDRAIVAAHRYVSNLSKGVESAAIDHDILLDAKTVHILHAVVRDADRPEGFSAFPSPQWMMDHLSRDEIAVLLHHYNFVAAQCSPSETDISEAKVNAIAAYCAEHAGTDLPTLSLLRCDREYLTELVIALSVKLQSHEYRVSE